MLFVISGPSGAGKSTLIRRVLDTLDNINFAVSQTTRSKREGEIEGKDYYFISEDEFKQMIQEDKLAEWAVVHGEHYGTLKREIEKKGAHADLILDIDIQGSRQIKEKYKKAVFIFIMPPLYEELKRRLEARGLESQASIQSRLDTARKEIRHYYHFDYVVINDDLEKAVLDLESIIRCIRSRFSSQEKKVLAILRSFSES